MSNLKITVLGSGSAYGVPFAGGDWGKCDPKQPRNRRLAPSILIENSDTKLLVDMGPDFRQQAEKHEIRLLDGVFFTHAHADHITGMFHLPIFKNSGGRCSTKKAIRNIQAPAVPSGMKSCHPRRCPSDH